MLGRLGLLLVLASASACTVFGLSAEDRANLAQFQERAQVYWQANRLPQALDQVRQGLEISPTDYKLHYVKGWVLMRQANDSRYATTPARRRGLLDDARIAFDAALQLRSFEDHGPQVLLGDALLHEELARSALSEKAQVEEEHGRPEVTAQERALLHVRRQEYALELGAHLARAQRDLEQLLKRGDVLLLAHKHMMSVKSLRGDYAGAVEHGQNYLERCRTAQAAKQKVFETTLQLGNEQKAAQELSGLVDDELTVRSQLANLHFDHGRYDLAVSELDRILNLDPGRSIDYYNRARALLESKRYDEAYRDVQKFLATHDLAAGHPSLVRAHDMLRRIEEEGRR